MKFEIFRLEGATKKCLCSQSYEQVELFQLIASNINYVIYKDGKDVTENYRK